MALEPVTRTTILYSVADCGAAAGSGVPESVPLALNERPAGSVEFVVKV
jgi:hypothetical protein